MKPREIKMGARVRARGRAGVDGTVRERVTGAGVPSRQGRCARVEFEPGVVEVHLHWQLELLVAAPPDPTPVLAKAPTSLAPQPNMASEPAPAPASCKPPRPPAWKDDQRVGAIFLNRQPNGHFQMSLVVTCPDGTSKNPLRLSDLTMEELVQELEAAGARLARIAKEPP